MSFEPLIPPQLWTGEPTAGANCAVSCICGNTEWATWGVIKPTVDDVRTFLKLPAGGLTQAQVLSAYQHFGVTAHRSALTTDAITALVEGKAIHAAVDYAWVNKNHPELSGDPEFLGQHAVTFIGHWLPRPGGAAFRELHDPLHDGRFQGGKRVPCQPVQLPNGVVVGYLESRAKGPDFIMLTRGAKPADNATDSLIKQNQQLNERLDAKDAEFATIGASAQRGAAA